MGPQWAGGARGSSSPLRGGYNGVQNMARVQAQIESTRVGLDEYNNAPSLSFKEYYARDLVEVISIGRTFQQFSCSEQEYASIQKRACSSS